MSDLDRTIEDLGWFVSPPSKSQNAWVVNDINNEPQVVGRTKEEAQRLALYFHDKELKRELGYDIDYNKKMNKELGIDQNPDFTTWNDGYEGFCGPEIGD